MSITTDIECILKDLTFTNEFKYYNSINIKKGTYEISTNDKEIIISSPDYEYSFYKDKVKLEVFKNRIDVYYLINTYFYKNKCALVATIYKPKQGFILNKHIIKLVPHRNFDLNKTIILHFKEIPYTNVYFVFDIEDKRETYANALNQIINQYNIPPEIIEIIGLYLGIIKPTKYDGIYHKSQFPINFVSKYMRPIPEYFIKEQLIELYELGILKIAIDNYCCSDLKILTDEAYDYVFPNGKPNEIKHAFSSKEEMHDFIDEQFEGFFEHVRQ
jgi:hypothetical protein